MGDDRFGDGDGALDDPLGTGDAGWESLELDRDGAAAAAPADPQDLMYGSSGGHTLGDGLEGLAGPGPELELDLDAVRQSLPPTDLPMPSEPPPPGSSPVARSMPPARTSTPPARTSAPPRRVSGAPARGSLAPAPGAPVPPRAITLADFGPAPSGILQSVPYAVHVLLRKRALNADLARLRRLHDGATRDVDEALIDLGRELHAHRDHEALEVLAGVVKAANDAGAVAGEHTAELARVKGAASSQKQALDEQIAALEAEHEPTRARAAELGERHDALRQAFQRADAKLSRAKIELRNLPTGEATDPGARQALEAELEMREAEAERALAEVEAVSPELTALRRELSGATKRIAALEKQKREIDQSKGRSEKALSGSAKAAEDHYHEAVKVLATHALSRGLAAKVAPRLVKLHDNRAQALATREEEIALHEIALTLADKAALQKGLAILGVVALLFLAVLVVVIVR